MMSVLQGTGWFAAPNWVFDSDLSWSEKLVYLYLCRRSGPDGSSWPSVSTIAADTGMSKRSVQQTLRSLRESGYITIEHRTDPETGSRRSNLYRLQSRTGGNDGNATPMQDVHPPVQEVHGPGAGGAPPLRTMCMGPVHLVHPEGLPSEGLPSEGQYNVAPSGPTSSEDPAGPKYDEDSMPYQLARHLRAAILMRDQETKVPAETPKALERWATEADRMIRLDGRDPHEAADLMTWCQQDSFWSANILSMSAFRRQYDRLKRQSARADPHAKAGQRETAVDRMLREKGVRLA